MTQINFKIDVKFGAYESLDWTNALMNAPNYIFDSSAIRIVEYKWINAQKLVWLHAMPYQVQSILIIIDTWFMPQNIYIKWTLLLTNLYLLTNYLVRMYFFIGFIQRRECSYHIEYEDNNRLK